MCDLAELVTQFAIPERSVPASAALATGCPDPPPAGISGTIRACTCSARPDSRVLPQWRDRSHHARTGELSRPAGDAWRTTCARHVARLPIPGRRQSAISVDPGVRGREACRDGRPQDGCRLPVAGSVGACSPVPMTCLRLSWPGRCGTAGDSRPASLAVTRRWGSAVITGWPPMPAAAGCSPLSTHLTARLRTRQDTADAAFGQAQPRPCHCHSSLRAEAGLAFLSLPLVPASGGQVVARLSGPLRRWSSRLPVSSPAPGRRRRRGSPGACSFLPTMPNSSRLRRAALDLLVQLHRAKAGPGRGLRRAAPGRARPDDGPARVVAGRPGLANISAAASVIPSRARPGRAAPMPGARRASCRLTRPASACW